MTIKPIPEGYRSITPYLILNDATAALAFYQAAFGAVERMRLPMPGDKIGHAEIVIGDSLIMLADEFPDMGCKSATTFGGSPIGIHLYVEDADKVFAQACAAGAKVAKPLENKFYGDRSGTLTDPFNYDWHIATHIEDVPEEELHRRLAALHS